jgi:hypothetical protein
VLQEPLLHFLMLAAGLFVLFRIYSKTPAAEEPDTIVVSEPRIESLILGFHRTWQRPPTQQELEGLIQDHIKEEVFYREALAMGLDQDDTLIRRRLRQKLEFVTENMADAVEPTDQLLFVAFLIMLAWSFRTLELKAPKWSGPLPAYTIGTCATYWFLGRVALILGI